MCENHRRLHLIIRKIEFDCRNRIQSSLHKIWINFQYLQNSNNRSQFKQSLILTRVSGYETNPCKKL